MSKIVWLVMLVVVICIGCDSQPFVIDAKFSEELILKSEGDLVVDEVRIYKVGQRRLDYISTSALCNMQPFSLINEKGRISSILTLLRDKSVVNLAIPYPDSTVPKYHILLIDTKRKKAGYIICGISTSSDGQRWGVIRCLQSVPASNVYYNKQLPMFIETGLKPTNPSPTNSNVR